MSRYSTLPQLSPSHKSVVPNLNSRPGFGRGIIYKVEWGFRLDKSHSYKGVGNYVGLTSGSVMDRLRGHIKAARSLTYKDGKVFGSGKTEDDGKPPRMFYLPLRVSMGVKNNSNIQFNKDYRVITAIKHINLFDLAYEEIKQIGGKQSSHNSFTTYADFVRSGAVKGSSRSNPVSLNETEGGEGNRMNSGGVEGKEKVMSALIFITEGRGSASHPDSLRDKIGIGKMKKSNESKTMVKQTLAEDVKAVFEYFRKVAKGFERMKGNAPSIQSINQIMKSLGMGISDGKVVFGEKIKLVDLMFSYGGETNNLSLMQSRVIKDAVIGGRVDNEVSELRIFSEKKYTKEEAKEILDKLLSSTANEFFLRVLLVKQVFILEKLVRKVDPKFRMGSIAKLSSKDLEKAIIKMNKMLNIKD